MDVRVQASAFNFGKEAQAFAERQSDMAFAEDASRSQISLETGLSTLGLFIAPDVRVAPRVHLRAPLYFGTVSQSRDINGNTFDGSLDVASFNLIADYYIGDQGVRLSGGLSIGGYEITGKMTNPSINGRTYSGEFSLDMQQTRQIAPVVSVGVRRSITDRWGLTADIGARFTGMTLTTTGQETLSASDQARYNADLADVNTDLRDIQAIPFVSIGARFEF